MKKNKRALPHAGAKRLAPGQSMFELLIAVFVIAITLVALVSLASRSIGNTTFSRERTQASKLTQEATEWLRKERDADWGAFKARASATGTNYCLATLSWSSGCGTVPGTGLSRWVTLISSPSNPDLVEAQVITSWSDSAGPHESRITTYLTNWRTR